MCQSCGRFTTGQTFVFDRERLCGDCARRVADVLLRGFAQGGPYESAVDAISDFDDTGGVLGDNYARLLAACTLVAGLELGEYDHDVITWLAENCEPSMAQVLTVLICRAANSEIGV